MSWPYWTRRLLNLGTYFGVVDNPHSVMWRMLVMLLLSAVKGGIPGCRVVGCQHSKPNLH